MTTLRIPHHYQGPSGTGQGGWASARFEEAVGRPITIGIRRGIPIETDLAVIETDHGWELRDGLETILTGVERTEPFIDTDPVDISTAAAARTRFPAGASNAHPAPDCFSCGPSARSMGVHAGPLSDGSGRFAVDWVVPEQRTPDGQLDEGVLWAALDCTTAWYVAYSLEPRPAFTVAYSCEITAPLRPGDTYALVAWNGDHPTAWDGRKRGGAAAAFAADGTCVARSRSFWVAVPDPVGEPSPEHAVTAPDD